MAKKSQMKVEDRQNYYKIFQKWDQDGNGHLTKQEVWSAFSSMSQGSKKDSKLMESFWRNIDANNDNVITFEEFLQYSTGFQLLSVLRAGSEDGGKTMPKDKLKGALQKNQLLPQTALDRCLAIIDGNNDNIIDLEELLQGFMLGLFKGDKN